MGDIFAAPLTRLNPRRFIYSASTTARIEVAISACLTGQRVRYDGADKFFAVTELLNQSVELTPVCPEVGAGLSVPRPPVQLVSTNSGLRARGRDDPALDVTAALADYAERSARAFIDRRTLCGYIWKSRSPSCGLASTPVFDTTGRQIATASGIQARHFQRQLPWLHCCEESDLNNMQAISVFVLICRLVFDLLRATPDSLAKTHRHYHFLQRCLSIDAQESLEVLSKRGAAIDYLIAVKSACAQMDHEELLGLFIE
jgi:uncharacterized protein YbbK (DUF523 family)